MNLLPLLDLWPTICRVTRWLTRRKPKPITLLIVEDDPLDAEHLQIQLKKRGYESEIATSAETAAGMVRHTFYPVIFVDLRLPTMSGQALLRILSRDAPNANAIVVCGEARDLEDLPPSRFVSVIRKPVTLDAIEEMIVKLKILTEL
jgi:CheY-like chemotaxis protein